MDAEWNIPFRGLNLAEIGARNPILQACSDQTRAALLSGGRLREFDAGELLFEAGDPAGVALFLLQGELQMSKSARRDRRQILCHLDSATCGGICLLTLPDRSLADVRALEPGLALLLPRLDLQALARSDPVLCQAAWGAVSQCLVHLSGLVESLSFQKVAQRVIDVLLASTDLEHPLTHRTQAELAAEVGTTREVVARCLADLQRSGAIRLGRGRITVMNRPTLQAFLERAE
jgi:CRP-like cAMP-binding protein